MAAQEWVSEDSQDYQKVLMFNDKDRPLMATAPGEQIDCYVYEAYAYVTKSDELVIGLVPKVQFATNMDAHPELAGEYVVNKITAVDRGDGTQPVRYRVDHRQSVYLDVLNHIIDLNRPDVFDPQTIYNNTQDFKLVAQTWADHNWLPAKYNDQIQGLPANRCDLIDDRVAMTVKANAAFKRALKQWREANWISEQKARQYAITGQPLKTIEDELSFKSEIVH